MKKQIIILIVGIVMFALGGYQNIQYEEHSLVIDAVITDIETIMTAMMSQVTHTPITANIP